MQLIYDIKPTIIEASPDYIINGENFEAQRIVDLRYTNLAIEDRQNKKWQEYRNFTTTSQKPTN